MARKVWTVLAGSEPVDVKSEIHQLKCIIIHAMSIEYFSSFIQYEQHVKGKMKCSDFLLFSAMVAHNTSILNLKDF
jgi:hypothetical protein